MVETFKSFERFGKISLESLLKLALVLECLGEFGGVCDEREDVFENISEVMGVQN